MDALLPTQPENYWKLIKRSLVLYRASFSHVIVLALLLSVIAFIPRIISDVIGQDLFFNLPTLSPHRLWLFVVNLAGLIFFIALIWRMWCVIRGVHEPFVQDFTIGFKKLLYVFVATVLQAAGLLIVSLLVTGLIIFMHEHQLISLDHPIGAILLPIVLILQFLLILYVFTLFYFYIPLISIENKGVLASLERSAYLVWNHWWRALSVQITPWMYYIIGLIIIKYAFNIDIHIYYAEYGAHTLWSTLLHIVIFALFVPWVAAILLIQLKDLELRKHLLAETK